MELARIVTTKDEAHSQFDPNFYGEFYQDLLSIPKAELKAHWDSFGKHEGRVENLERLLATFITPQKKLREQFSVEAYRFFNQDLATFLKTDVEYIRHYLNHGLAENRRSLFQVPSKGDRLKFTNEVSMQGGIDDGLKSEIARVLLQAGVQSLRFLSIFKPVDYMLLNKEAKLESELHCLAHFATTGVRHLAPIAVDYVFDAQFYRGVVGEVSVLSDFECYLHWLNTGIEAGYKPNAKILMSDLGLRNTAEFPAGFNAKLYYAANSDVLNSTSPWLALQHAIEWGIIESRRGVELSVETLDLYLAVADRLSMAGHLARAVDIYTQVLLLEPAQGQALQHLGDCLLRLGEHHRAAAAYRQNIAIKTDSVWTHLNLAKALSGSGDLTGASKVLTTLYEQSQGDENIRRVAEAAATEAFQKIYDQANWLAANELYDEAREQMSVAVDIVRTFYEIGLPAETAICSHEISKILLVADVSLPQCEFYRVSQKIEHIRAAGISVELVELSAIQRAPAALLDTHAVIFYRVPGIPEVICSIAAARKMGLPTFYEIDDLTFDDRYFPDTLTSYGGLVDRPTYGRLVTGTALFASAMKMCDYGIASTQALAQLIRTYVRSQKCFVHKNALGSAHEAAISNHHPTYTVQEKTRIFYGTGTRAHNEDFELIAAPALARLLEMFGDKIELILMGYLVLPNVLKGFESQITCLEPVFEIGAYWELLSQMHINLAVLKPSLAADAKSEIKWLEAAMFGIPSVLSDTDTHRSLLQFGAVAVLAADTEAWFKALRSLIENEDLRINIGAAAKAAVAERYSVQSSLMNITHILNEVTRISQKQPKIVVVNVFYPPQVIGGATRVVADNVLHFRRSGAIDVEVFTTIEGSLQPYEVRRYLWDGVPVTAVATPNTNDVDRNPSDPIMAGLFKKFLLESRPDVVHFHCIQRLTASLCGVAKGLGIPYVVTPHDGWWISEFQFLLDESLNQQIYDVENFSQALRKQGTSGYYRAKTLKRHLEAANYVLPVSQTFAKLYKAATRGEIRTVENGVSQIDPLPRLPSLDGKLRLLFMGGLDRSKGYDLLKVAFFNTSFQNLCLTVIDHQMQPGTVRSTVWGTTNVTYVSKVSSEAVNLLYARHDVLLAPSLWCESYGLVTREAAISGCWIVASDRGAIGDIVTNGNGFRIDVSDCSQLVETLKKLDENWQRYAMAPLERPAIRSSAAQATDLLNLYLDLVEQTSSGRDASGTRTGIAAIKPDGAISREPIAPKTSKTNVVTNNRVRRRGAGVV